MKARVIVPAEEPGLDSLPENSLSSSTFLLLVEVDLDKKSIELVDFFDRDEFSSISKIREIIIENKVEYILSPCDKDEKIANQTLSKFLKIDKNKSIRENLEVLFGIT